MTDREKRLRAEIQRWERLAEDSKAILIPGKPPGQPTPAGAAMLVCAGRLATILSQPDQPEPQPADPTSPHAKELLEARIAEHDLVARYLDEDGILCEYGSVGWIRNESNRRFELRAALEKQLLCGLRSHFQRGSLVDDNLELQDR